MNSVAYRPRINMKRLFPIALLLTAFTALGENWAQWRGPFFNGSTTETNLPSQWSQTENVAWKAPMPGVCGATPVIWGDSVFVSTPDEQKDLRLICYNLANGEVRWQQVASSGNREEGLNTTASPSPVTDGQRVIVCYATGDLTAFDLGGKKLWNRNLVTEFGRFANMWMYGSTPLLYRQKLYVQVLQQNPVPPEYRHAQDGRSARESFLLCIEPDTGRTLWRHVRPSDAVNESMEAYSTPIPWENSSGRKILVVGGNYATAHNPDTGDELWRFGGLNVRNELHWRHVTSPVTSENIAIVCAPRGDPVLAIRDGGKGVVTESHLAWKFKDTPADCVTPLVYQNRLYVLDGDHQNIACLEPATGKKLWQGNLGVREVFRASPAGADGKIYCVGEGGTVAVLAAGDEFKILSTIPMHEGPVRSSIAIANGRLLLRTAKHLYCVRKP